MKSAIVSEKLTENSVEEIFVITWLDAERAVVSSSTKIKVGDQWLNVGHEKLQQFSNDSEGKGMLGNSVPEPFLTAIEAVWNFGGNDENGK